MEMVRIERESAVNRLWRAIEEQRAVNEDLERVPIVHGPYNPVPSVCIVSRRRVADITDANVAGTVRKQIAVTRITGVSGLEQAVPRCQTARLSIVNRDRVLVHIAAATVRREAGIYRKIIPTTFLNDATVAQSGIDHGPRAGEPSTVVNVTSHKINANGRLQLIRIVLKPP